MRAALVCSMYAMLRADTRDCESRSLRLQSPRALDSTRAFEYGFLASDAHRYHICNDAASDFSKKTFADARCSSMESLPMHADPLLRFFDASAEYRAHKRRISLVLVSP